MASSQSADGFMTDAFSFSSIVSGLEVALEAQSGSGVVAASKETLHARLGFPADVHRFGKRWRFGLCPRASCRRRTG